MWEAERAISPQQHWQVTIFFFFFKAVNKKPGPFLW